jgi:hypothetical protein
MKCLPYKELEDTKILLAYLKALRQVKSFIPMPPSVSRRSPSAVSLGPVSPESYLRRHRSMIMSRRDVAITTRAFRRSSCQTTRLSLRGRNRLLLRFPIRFPLFQNPIRSLRQVTSHRAHRLLVTLALTDPQVKPTDMSIRSTAMKQTDDIPGFNECPLEVTIDIRSKLSIAGLTS